MSSLQEPSACDGQNFANDAVIPSDSCTGGTLLAMTWIPAQTETISRVEIFTGFSGGTRVPNRLAIWSDDGGLPSQPLMSLASTGPFTVVPTNSWQGANLSTSITVTAGQKYWVVWDPDVNQTCSASTDPDGVHLAYWSSFAGTVDGGTSWFGPFGQPYNNQSDDRLKFRMFCTVDCPSSLSVDGFAPDFCEGQAQGISVTLNGFNLSEATINWSLTGPTPNSSLGSGATLSTTLMGLTPGAYSIVATVSTSGCSDTVATRDFTVHAKPASSAGPDQVFCENSSTILAGNTPAGTGTWTILGGASATIVEPHNPNTVVTDLAYGDTFFRWTVDDGTCQNGDDIVAITRHQSPTISNAGPDQSFCETSSTTLTANAPDVGDAHWELVSGVATITDPFSATTTVTDLGYGTHTFQWVISNGSCERSIDSMTITRYQTPAPANAGPDFELCETSVLAISANEPAAGSGMWTIVSGGGTIDNPNHFAAGINNLPYGETILRWTISNGDCESTSDEMKITRHQTPVAIAGPNQNLCETDATTMAATVAVTGTGTWTLVSGAGNILEPNNPNTLITGLGYGENKFRWRISNTCATSSDVVKITRDQAPTVAVAGPNQTFCETSTATLAGNTPVTGTGTWTLVSGSGTITDPNNPATTVTDLGYGANVLRWRIKNESCPASADTVKITRYQAPTVADAGPDQMVCETEATLAANTPTVGIGSWVLVSGSGLVVSPNSPSSRVINLGMGANVFKWKIDNGSCAASTDKVTITQITCASKLWLGGREPGNSSGALRNVDVRAEVYKNGILIGSGQLDDLFLNARTFNDAVASLLNISLPAPVAFAPGDTLAFRLLARYHTNAIFKSDLNVFLWINSPAADSQFTIVVNGQLRTFYLLDQFALGNTSGPGPRQTVTTVLPESAAPSFVDIGVWTYTF